MSFKNFYFQTLLGGGTWTVKVRKKMREKYFLSRDQYIKMEAPTLRGTKLNMAVKGVNFSSISKTLLNLHQQARDMVKLGLQEQKILLCNSRRARKC